MPFMGISFGCKGTTPEGWVWFHCGSGGGKAVRCSAFWHLADQDQIEDAAGVRQGALHGVFQKLSDQALVGDATLGGFGFERGQQGFGKAHVDAGGFGGGFPGEGAELGGVEGGEVLGEEGFG